MGMVLKMSEEVSKKIALQEKYCTEKKIPFYAPKERCFSCRKNIWYKITEEEASSRLITGCPYCNSSYVE